MAVSLQVMHVLHGMRRIERLEMLDEFEEWALIQVSSFGIVSVPIAALNPLDSWSVFDAASPSLHMPVWLAFVAMPGSRPLHALVSVL